MFFIISGFLLFSSMESKKDGTAYFRKYMRRIVQIYLIWTAIYIPAYITDVYLNSKEFSIIICILFLLRDILFKGIYRLWYLHALIIGISIIYFFKYKHKMCNSHILVITGFGYVLGVLTTSWSGLFYDFPIHGNIGFQILETVYKATFQTTRNGFFFGAFFIAVGVSLKKCKVTITKKKCFLFMILWYIILVIEAFLLHQLKWASDYSMMFTLVPVTYYLTRFTLLCDFNNVKFAVHLRSLSTLIYLIHPLLICALSFCGIYSGRSNSVCVFTFVLLVTLILSEFIIKASKKYKLLKKLY